MTDAQFQKIDGASKAKETEIVGGIKVGATAGVS
jgi:hypothetical protein